MDMPLRLIYIYIHRESSEECFLKRIFGLISPNLKKKNPKYKFSWLALLIKHSSIKLQPNTSEQEKKRKGIYVLLDAEPPPKKKKSVRNNWSLIMVSIKPTWLRYTVLENKIKRCIFQSKYWFV